MPAKEIKAALTTKGKLRRGGVNPKDLLKTGSTVLDLAISGDRRGGFPKGKYIWMVGDSSSGKTFLMLTCLAEASINPEFKNYRLIYDNAEDGALMDMAKYYGEAMAERTEPPAWGIYEELKGVMVFKPDPPKKQENAAYSQRIEDFYYNLDDALTRAEEGGEPFIYLLDSMDALDSKYAEAKFQEAKKEGRGGAKAKGDYGDGKAKKNSTYLRGMVQRLSDTGSILVILSQTRDNIDAGMFDEQQVAAGGKALKFYATVQLWSSVAAKIKKTVAGRDIIVGVMCRVKTKKNRLTGKERTVEFPIYYGSGIDDIGGMVDYLTYWKFWPKNKTGVINATADFDEIEERREPLIKWLEDNDMRADLEEVVADAFAEVERRAAVERKPKY
jgi:RecA/RadA recombinase